MPNENSIHEELRPSEEFNTFNPANDISAPTTNAMPSISSDLITNAASKKATNGPKISGIASRFRFTTCPDIHRSCQLPSPSRPSVDGKAPTPRCPERDPFSHAPGLVGSEHDLKSGIWLIHGNSTWQVPEAEFRTTGVTGCNPEVGQPRLQFSAHCQSGLTKVC